MAALLQRFTQVLRPRTLRYLGLDGPARPEDALAAPSVPAAAAPAGIDLARTDEYEVLLAHDPADIEQAMRLRWEVFAGEMHARIGSVPGIDRDIFDPYCEHLIVRERAGGRVVGTYRVLLPERAARLGCLYTEGEFWLTRLGSLRPELVELGRSCVHPDHRRGAVIMLLWSGLREMLSRTPYRMVIGCVSVPMADGGHAAADLWRRLATRHLADESLRVWPRERLELERLGTGAEPPVPALMKGYLRLGAQLLGEPHVDRDFGCADFPMMLNLDAIDERYARRFAPTRAELEATREVAALAA